MSWSPPHGITDLISSNDGLDSHSQNRKLVQQLQPHFGTDATEALEAELDSDGPLMTLARMRDKIVAVVEPQPQPAELPEMAKDELRRFDGQANKAEGWKNDAFVAVGGLVYDMTDPHDYGSTNPNYSGLEAFLGRSVRDGKLAEYLRNNCEHRVCARLATNKTPKQTRHAVKWNPKKSLLPRPKLSFIESDIGPPQPRPLPTATEIAPHHHPKTTPLASHGDPPKDRFEEEEIFVPTPSPADLEGLINDLNSEADSNEGFSAETMSHAAAAKSVLAGVTSSRELRRLKERRKRRLAAELRRRTREKERSMQKPDGEALRQILEGDFGDQSADLDRGGGDEDTAGGPRGWNNQFPRPPGQTAAGGQDQRSSLKASSSSGIAEAWMASTLPAKRRVHFGAKERPDKRTRA